MKREVIVECGAVSEFDEACNAVRIIVKRTST